MKLTKRLLALIFGVLMIVGATLPAFAANARMGHGVDYTTVFQINSSGLATVRVSYAGNRKNRKNAVFTYEDILKGNNGENK